MDGMPGWLGPALIAWALAIPIGGVAIVRWKNRHEAKKESADK